MRHLQFYLPLWSLCISTVAAADVRGQQNEWYIPKDRALLGNVFNTGSEALKQSLSTQRRPYQDPYFDEPKTLSLVTKPSNEFAFRNIGNARDGHVEEEVEEETEAPYYGKGSSSSSKSKSKGKGMSKSKSKSTMSSKSKSKGAMSRSGGMSATSYPTVSRPVTTEAPTLTPTEATETPTLPPTLPATDVPTCSPTSGFFPPEVSGFFQAPTGDTTDLQNELNSALNDIQVPNTFQQQCVER